MNPINIHQVISGKEFTTTMIPLDAVSHGRSPVAFAQEADERIQVLSNTGFATLHCSNWQHRERLCKQINRGNVRELRVDGNDIQAIKVVLFERGWPHQSSRTVMLQDSRTGDGVESYCKTFLPPPQRSDGIVFLASGYRPQRQVHVIQKDSILDFGLRGRTVTMEVPMTEEWHLINIVTPSVETAEMLGRDLKIGRIHTIEFNDMIRAVLLGNNHGTRIYGISELPKELVDAFAKHTVHHRKYPDVLGEPYHELPTNREHFEVDLLPHDEVPE